MKSKSTPRILLLTVFGFVFLFAVVASGVTQTTDTERDVDDWSELDSGEKVYRATCAACHGTEGTGTDRHLLGFEPEVPDFTDCSFASREPQPDWFIVAHAGGPVRGFDRMMPAFGGALTDAQLDMAATHVKAFCTDDNWPDGQFNIPRALVTGKAYPEDEVIFELETTTSEPVAAQFTLVLEKRIGERNQVELILPMGVKQVETVDANGDTATRLGEGFGDLGLAWKGVLWHNLRLGTIGSLGTEVFLPFGDEEDEFSKGIFRFEPFIAVGQLIPGDNFFQLHAGAELSTDTDVAYHELFFRGALGHTFTQGRFGRAWSPMIEGVGVVELEDRSEVAWSVVPALHVTLNQRQHVMLVMGAEIPVTDFEDRQVTAMLYLLWDWFDGGFGDGW